MLYNEFHVVHMCKECGMIYFEYKMCDHDVFMDIQCSDLELKRIQQQERLQMKKDAINKQLDEKYPDENRKDDDNE